MIAIEYNMNKLEKPLPERAQIVIIGGIFGASSQRSKLQRLALLSLH